MNIPDTSTLPTQQEIISRWADGSVESLITILCIAYNHEAFIEDAIKGFLIQDTTFPFEIVIHDDASTDRTAEIIRKYQGRYPRLIKSIYQTENQYSKGVRIIPYLLSKTNSKYIAICEGDDYWTDTQKLNIQVGYLEKHSDCSLCFHQSIKRFESHTEKQEPFVKKSINSEIKTEDIIKNWLIPTQSIVLRRSSLPANLPPWLHYIMNVDWAIQLLCSLTGSIKYIDREMSVYRIHAGGLNSTAFGKIDRLYNSMIRTLLYFDDYSDYKFSVKIKNKIASLLIILLIIRFRNKIRLKFLKH
jgi:glycosyltransferase involved in cell wall biosynthesis